MKRLWVLGLLSLGSLSLQGSDSADVSLIQNVFADQQADDSTLDVSVGAELQTQLQDQHRQQFGKRIQEIYELEPKAFDEKFSELKAFYTYHRLNLNVDQIQVQDLLVTGMGTLGAQLEQKASESKGYQKTQLQMILSLVHNSRSAKNAAHPEDMLMDHINACIQDPLGLTNNDKTGRNGADRLLERYFEAGEYNIWTIKAEVNGKESIAAYLTRIAEEDLGKDQKDRTCASETLAILKESTVTVLKGYLEEGLEKSLGVPQLDGLKEYQRKMQLDIDSLEWSETQMVGPLLDRSVAVNPHLQSVVELFEGARTMPEIMPTNDVFCNLVKAAVEASREGFKIAYDGLRNFCGQDVYDTTAIDFCLELTDDGELKGKTVFDYLNADEDAQRILVRDLVCGGIDASVKDHTVRNALNNLLVVPNEQAKRADFELLFSYWPLDIDKAIFNKKSLKNRLMESVYLDATCGAALEILAVVQPQRSDKDAVIRELVLKAIGVNAQKNYPSIVDSISEWLDTLPGETDLYKILSDPMDKASLSLGKLIDRCDNQALKALFEDSDTEDGDEDEDDEDSSSEASDKGVATKVVAKSTQQTAAVATTKGGTKAGGQAASAKAAQTDEDEDDEDSSSESSDKGVATKVVAKSTQQTGKGGAVVSKTARSSGTSGAQIQGASGSASSHNKAPKKTVVSDTSKSLDKSTGGNASGKKGSSSWLTPQNFLIAGGMVGVGVLFYKRYMSAPGRESGVIGGRFSQTA